MKFDFVNLGDSIYEVFFHGDDLGFVRKRNGKWYARPRMATWTDTQFDTRQDAGYYLVRQWANYLTGQD